MDSKRISACTFPLRERDLDYTFKVIKDSGFDRVDLLARMPHFSVTDPDYSQDELARMCQKHEIEVANIGAYCGRGFVEHGDALDAAVKEMDDTLEAAKRFGARTIRVVPGSGKRADINTVVPYFRKAAEKAEKYGVYMGIENHGTEISGNPEACVEICEKVGSPYFGIIYEPCNLMAAGTEYKSAFETFKAHVVHVHVKDGHTNAEGKWERTMLGEGEIDYHWVYDEVEATGYTGHWALEFEVGHIEPVETGYRKWLDTWMGM